MIRLDTKLGFCGIIALGFAKSDLVAKGVSQRIFRKRLKICEIKQGAFN